jgi:hypothetical protein
MDAYLSQEAHLSLTTLTLLSPAVYSDGLLIGHKRGHRFFVEKILSSMPGFFPSLKKYHELENLYQGKLLGFYSFRPDEKKINKILGPYACGKLLLKIQLNPQKKISIKPFVIDYKNNFFLLPVKLIKPNKKKQWETT